MSHDCEHYKGRSFKARPFILRPTDGIILHFLITFVEFASSITSSKFYEPCILIAGQWYVYNIQYITHMCKQNERSMNLLGHENKATTSYIYLFYKHLHPIWFSSISIVIITENLCLSSKGIIQSRGVKLILYTHTNNQE